MTRQVATLKHLVADILDISRINSQRIELQRTIVDLRSIVAHAVETEQEEITKGQLELSTRLPAEPVWVEGDAIRLEQIIANLLDNAAKYTDPGGRINLPLEVAGHKNGTTTEQAVLHVNDSGIGIQPAQLDRVFGLFARGDNSPARHQGGLGVGLSLVKALVELHGGSVEAHSAGPGKGSEFIVRLALATEPQRAQQSINVLTTAPKAKSVARRIFIVDDNVDAAESLADLLSSFGHDVQIAFDGPAALATASIFRPEVIFLDIGMPGMDGYQVARQLREQNGLEKTMIVALTGYGRDVDRQRTQDAGFDAHLMKPIDLDTLTNILSMRGERC